MTPLDGDRELDRALERAMQRTEPPAGFAERVQRLADQRPAPVPVHSERQQHRPARMWPALDSRPAPWPTASRWVPLAAAAALILAIGGGALASWSWRQERAERRAGEAAGAQVMVALQIAGSKLQLVQARVNRIHDAPPKVNQ